MVWHQETLQAEASGNDTTGNEQEVFYEPCVFTFKVALHGIMTRLSNLGFAFLLLSFLNRQQDLQLQTHF